MEGFLEFGFLLSFATTMVLINLGMINFLRGSEKWKKNLMWSLVPIALICLCVIAYPDTSMSLNLP